MPSASELARQEAEHDEPVSTKATPGPFDAFATAKPGEPIFTLQGGDVLAPPLVESWARDARAMALRLIEEGDEGKGNNLKTKATNAEEVAWAMRAYQRDEHDVDAPAPEETGAAGQALDIWDIRRNLERELTGMVGRLTEITELMDKHGLLGATISCSISRAQDALSHVAADVAVKRGV